MKTYSRVGEDGRVLIEDRITRYLGTWSEGLSTARMNAWVDSCYRGGGYTLKEYMDALRRLRDSGRIAFACGIWYLRKQ